MAQVLIFFLLGLLVTPLELPEVIVPAVLIMLFLTFVARPLSIAFLLGIFRSPLKQIFVVSWAGLRGVASIVFAIYAVLYQVDLPFDLFNLVFCIVLFSLSIQGSLLPWISKKCHMINHQVDILRTFNDYQENNDISFVKMKIDKNHQFRNKKLKDINSVSYTHLITANHFMNDSEAPYKAADGANDTKWCGEDTSTSHQPTWLKMDLGENSYDVKGFTVYSAGNEKSDYISKNFSVQGSNDGETWTDIVTVKDNDIRERDITLDKTVNYRYYRLWLTEAVQDDNPKNTARIYEFKIWGQKDEVKVPTVKDVAITAFVSEENSNESVYQASYRFVPMSDEDSDSKTKVEWFKTVNGEKTPIDKTGKTITLANEEAFTWESLSVREMCIRDRYRSWW